MKDLAVGTAALVLTRDPQIVVFGGGFSRSADLVIEPLRQELEKLVLRVPEVRASTLGADGVGWARSAWRSTRSTSVCSRPG